MTDDDRLWNVGGVHDGNDVVREPVHTEIRIRRGLWAAGLTMSALVDRDDPNVP